MNYKRCQNEVPIYNHHHITSQSVKFHISVSAASKMEESEEKTKVSDSAYSNSCNSRSQRRSVSLFVFFRPINNLRTWFFALYLYKVNLAVESEKVRNLILDGLRWGWVGAVCLSPSENVGCAYCHGYYMLT